MIIVYRIDNPGIIFATHSNHQEVDIAAKYPSSDYVAVKGATDDSLEPGNLVPDGFTMIAGFGGE